MKPKNDGIRMKIGDEVMVDRGSLPSYFGKLVELYRQGWWEYGVVEQADGTFKGYDSDVHVLKLLGE